ncbi:MAG: hypothetical protein Q8R79_03675 [Legionellaceae bacterium]|nr:hypothetical protein [Legionellaceae bacterium]
MPTSPAILKKLRSLIDAQDVTSVKQFVIDHDINLNNVTSTGLSALWWVLMPPEGKTISEDLVHYLREKQVDITQHHRGKDIRSLFIESNSSKNSEALKKALSQYWDYYGHQNLENIVIPYQAPVVTATTPLAQFQDTHNSVVVRLIDTAVVQLYQHYAPHNSNNILPWDKSFDDFLKNSQTVLGKDFYLASNAITRIQKDTTTRSYTLSTKPLEIVDLTNSQVLMLLYKAVCDQNAQSFAIGSDMSKKGQAERKILLLRHLIQSQKEYGDNSPACWMGTRNQMVSALDSVHVKVSISTHVPISPAIIGYKYDQFCKTKLTEHAASGTFLYEYLFYYVLSGLPTGDNANNALDDDPEKNIPETLKKAIQRIKQDFKDSLSAEFISLNPKDKNTVEQYYTGIAESFGVSIALAPKLLLLQKLAQAARSTPSLFPIQTALEKLMTEIKNDPSALTEERLLQIQKEAADAFTLSSLPENSSCDPLTAAYLTLQNQEQQQEMLPYLGKAYLEHILQAEGTPFPLPESVGVQALMVYISEKIPNVGPWLQTLPENYRNALIQQWIDKKYLPFIEGLQENILEDAFQFGLFNGQLKNFKIEKPISIKNQDFRGIDLSTLDLTHIRFENCDLRLSDIEHNPTLKLEHLQDKNTLDPSWFFTFCNQHKSDLAMALLGHNNQHKDLEEKSIDPSSPWFTQVLDNKTVIEEKNTNYLLQKNFMGKSPLQHAIEKKELALLSKVLKSINKQYLLEEKKYPYSFFIFGPFTCILSENQKKEAFDYYNLHLPKFTKLPNIFFLSKHEKILINNLVTATQKLQKIWTKLYEAETSQKIMSDLDKQQAMEAFKAWSIASHTHKLQFNYSHSNPYIGRILFLCGTILALTFLLFLWPAFVSALGIEGIMIFTSFIGIAALEFLMIGPVFHIKNNKNNQLIEPSPYIKYKQAFFAYSPTKEKALEQEAIMQQPAMANMG